ncbi:hypothetical protein WMY93_021794 [Mugilogobius chulae]|uniref:Uncharacterized protein n=1 Tax=Mugilogobius chulae TaxID=88201 RepID=A0AAW0NMX3_9GOBI
MNVDVHEGRRGTDDDDARGGGRMDDQVLPFEMYDSARAKVAANLHWLIAKALGPDDIPSDLQDPFYTDQYEQEHIKPPVIHLLLSAELYCRVSDVPFHPEQHSFPQNHTSVIQALSRKGLHVHEDNGSLISERDLASAPVKMSSHIHLIDALITAYTEEMISVEKVVSAVQGFAETSESTVPPLDLEDAMMFWINKVILKLRGFTQKEMKMKHLLDSPCHQKCPSKWYWKLLPVRYRKDQLSGRSHPHVPVLDNLSSFVCVGTSLLVVVHFYCPELIRLEDICLKEVLSTTESLSNIQLLREFSAEFLNKCVYLRPEDMLYSPPVLKINIMQIIADLFWIFEVVKPDFVQPRDIPQNKDVRKPQSSSKRRFWTSNSEETVARATGSLRCLKTGSNPAVLPLRQKEQNVIDDHTLGQRTRSHSFVCDQQTTNFAWPRKRQRPVSQTVPYTLHFPMKEDADSLSIARSMSKDSLASSFMCTTPNASGLPHRLNEEEEIEEEELVSIINPTALSRLHHQSETEHRDILHSLSHPTAKNTHTSHGLDRCPATTELSLDKYYLEPLMPAIPKPAKEKTVRVNKKEECGESNSKGAFTVRKPSTSGAGAFHRTALQSESSSTLQKRASNFGDGESLKLGEDQKVREWDDKEDHSGCSSPCLSSASWSSSGPGVKMTSFAEKKLLKLHGGFFSSPSTPDDSDFALCPPWQMKSSGSSHSLGKDVCFGPRAVTMKTSLTPSSSVPTELLELHMQLEERRHAIEYHKKNMETLSAQQRLKLGKTAFLNIVKKETGRSDTLPLPVKQRSSEPRAANQEQVKPLNFKDDSCLETLKIKAQLNEGAPLKRDTSVEVLNEAIASIQQQINKLSLQQDLLIKHRSVLPCESQSPDQIINPSTEPKAFVVNFVNNDDSSLQPLRCPPKLSSKIKKSDKDSEEEKREAVEKCKPEQNLFKNCSFSICHDNKQMLNLKRDIYKEPMPIVDNSNKIKTQLIEVDLSEIKEPEEQNSGDTETKNALGFFFKDEDRTDEMAKRRAAFMIKQQRKAEEAKLRKQQQEVESEIKRDEARRKAEEERIRKEEEKARREFIKQEYLRRKQQMLMEEQGLGHHIWSEQQSPWINTIISLEVESIVSVDSQRAESVCSVESFPVLSRASSRNMERDWEIGSIASSVTSTEYTGPKLFKEPSSKSNKPIIINAIAHCCLAGKVNETQKNVILEELDKCESNHFIILFRDGGCQFRAIYAYSPDTEEITKVTGTGPRNICHKMIDKLYKYSSDRKQFSIIPAKSVSVSVDALTIHNQLWHVKRPGSARRK